MIETLRNVAEWLAVPRTAGQLSLHSFIDKRRQHSCLVDDFDLPPFGFALPTQVCRFAMMAALPVHVRRGLGANRIPGGTNLRTVNSDALSVHLAMPVPPNLSTGWNWNQRDMGLEIGHHVHGDKRLSDLVRLRP
jgi:hypothetical protein